MLSTQYLRKRPSIQVYSIQFRQPSYIVEEIRMLIYDGHSFENKFAFRRREIMGLFRKKGKKDEIFDLADRAFKLYQSGNLQEAADLYARCMSLRDQHNVLDEIEIDLIHYYHICHYLGRRGEALALFNRYNQLSSPMGIGVEAISMVTYPLSLDEKGRKLQGMHFEFG